MAYGNKFGKEVPSSYVHFLNDHPDGIYLDYRVDPNYESETRMFSETELVEVIEMYHIGTAQQFEFLKLTIKFQRDFGYADVDEPNLSEEEMIRVENGFVIGYGDNFGGYGYLYLDASDNHSVWMYNSNNGQISKVADSFEAFINSIQKQ